MNQALLLLSAHDTAAEATATHPAGCTDRAARAPAGHGRDTTVDPALGPADRVAFDIGWDHAHHGLVPPVALLHPDTPVAQGWMAGKAVFGRRTLPCRRSTRQWLALRVQAWREGVPFERQLVTANFLGQIHAARCPVQRQALGGASEADSAAVVQRLNPQAAYAAGNLAVMSPAAARALHSHTVAEAVRQARALEAATRLAGLRGTTASTSASTSATATEHRPDGSALAQGLDAGGWWRVATLRAFATPLPFHEAARLPLAVMPPNRVRLLNPVQGLQALVTALFEAPGWSARCRALAARLPAHTLRHDFNLFVGAMAPRVLEAGRDPVALRRALEDAWLLDRVQRRWQHWVLGLGEAGTAHLLSQVAAAGLAGRRTMSHADEQAVDGWSLATPLDADPNSAQNQAPNRAPSGALRPPHAPQEAATLATRRALRLGDGARPLQRVMQPLVPFAARVPAC